MTLPEMGANSKGRNLLSLAVQFTVWIFFLLLFVSILFGFFFYVCLCVCQPPFCPLFFPPLNRKSHKKLSKHFSSFFLVDALGIFKFRDITGKLLQKMHDSLKEIFFYSSQCVWLDYDALDVSREFSP